MKHTKGNWELDSKIPTRVLCNGGDIHIDVRYYDHKEQEAEANAKLIASIPKLLDLATEAVAMINNHFEGVELTVGDWKRISDMSYIIKKATE